MKRGMRFKQPDLVVHVRRGSDGNPDGPRVGLVVGKIVGSAVERHRVSRRLRHVLRAMLDELAPIDQLVIRALPGSRTASSGRLEHQLRRCVQRALATGTGS